MQNITVTLSDAEAFALDLIAVDKQEWAENTFKNRARVAKEEIKNTENWADALIALSASGGDTSDEWAVLLHAKELNLVKTAKEISDLQDLASPEQEVTHETVPTDIALNRVQFKSMLAILNIKIDQINAAIDEAITDQTQNTIAKVKVTESELYHRNDALFSALAPAIGLTSDQIDTAWAQALQI
jgi:hypothetical protein